MVEKTGGQKRSTRYAGLPSRDHNGTWRIRWIDENRKRRSRNFPADAYQDAVAELERIKGEVRAIKDGRAPAPRTAPTFQRFWEKYYEPNRTAAKRSPKDDKSMMRKHLLPAFGDRRIDRISTDQIETFKAKLRDADLSPKTASNVLTLLGAVLRYAQELDFVYRMPKIKRPQVHHTQFDFLESDSQIRAFLNSARDERDGVFALYATAIYTGMRAGELFGLRWSDVDFKRGLIRVQRSFNKPTKSGRSRVVPVLDVLKPILKTWRLKNKNELVFPNEVGNMHTPNPRVTKAVFKAVLSRAGLPPIRFHDLRHTFASHWVMKGGDLFRLQKILGHADQQMVQRYAHLAPDAFDKDKGIFGDAPQPPEVVKLEPKRKTK